jgi:hypothetical protein
VRFVVNIAVLTSQLGIRTLDCVHLLTGESGLLQRIVSSHAHALACAIALLGFASARDVCAELAPAQIHQVLMSFCEPAGSIVRPADALLSALGGGIELSATELDAPVGVKARRHQLMLPDGTRLRLDLHRRGDALAQVIIEVTRRIGVVQRPWLWVVADGRCQTRVARRLEYADAANAVAVLVLGEGLEKVRSRQLLDAPVPVSAPRSGVTVAMIDSGVNYTIAALSARLARDANGTLIGFDYWDMDPRPFDSHPSPSAFIPQRHGTRTASVMLDDAPMALLAPVRYPRPDMARMTRLVAELSAQGISIVNLSLGGDQQRLWTHFEQAARAHPQMLFIVSAGNNARDLDEHPVYPASFSLDNLITVGSADAQGLPARGSNWGRRSVHVLVPAEQLVATDFSGYAVRVAGSSYAAARVSALAACFQAAHPQWRAAQLKAAIFALAVQPLHPSMAYVAVGVLPEPTSIKRGACAAEPDGVVSLGRLQLEVASIYPEQIAVALDTASNDGAARVPAPFTHELAPLTLVWLENAGWPLDALLESVSAAARIYRQCGVRFGEVSIQLLRVPRGMRYYDTANAIALMKARMPTTPAVWFMRDTLQEPAFDAETIGRSNAMRGSGLLNTIWMTAQLEHHGVALAHELYHLIANTGAHVPEKDNLLHAQTSAKGTLLWDWQCERLLKVGGAFELLKPL